MAGFNTYSDAAPTVLDDRREEEFERLVDEKYDEIRDQIKTVEGADAFLRAYEPEMAQLFAALVVGNFKVATLELERIISEVALNEAEGDVL